MRPEADAGRSVTSKVLAILGAFEDGPHSQPLTQLADAAGIPLSTAHRLVGELVEWGALEKGPDARYTVGLRLWEVAQQGGRQLRDAARPYLQDLFLLTNETTHLAIREGHEALYIDRVYSSKRVPRASRVGGRLPLHATAVGKVLLAYEEPWLQHAYLERDLETPTTRTHVNPRWLQRELAQVREQGYAITVEEVRAGSCSIAVPVFAASGAAPASIGLVMLAGQADQMSRYLPVLNGIADRISPAVSRLPQAATRPRQR
ncbi:IclR family transcriptional regulator [Gordonia sp. FQ]|uniref:IclR family transcriptional regulator n=1 Tax=Gordonia sp. FQ TaxID=3446634 RepID=UPI003F8503B5